ncbi:MAG: carbon monoxide dehydrogenase [Alphaproteobacteria bacterium]|nr:carbon monoxide dehydrogenase [Alphaproteobacteria bacterium]PHY01554.1 MAG: carbon monoxide dehydrogenase [Rhodospirillaceae bacterium]
MDMKGEYRIPAPRAAVWAALNDVDVLKAAIPGCDSINRLSDTEIEATVTAKIGPVKASFKGLVTLSDIDPPNGYTIRGEGKGGPAGFAKGGAKVRLVDVGSETILSYKVDASVGGKIAQIGARLIDSTAKKLADEFFAKFSALAAAKASDHKASASDAQPKAHASLETSMTQNQASATVTPILGKNTWIIGALVVVVIVIVAVVYIFGY